MTEMRPEKKVKDRHPGVLSQYQNPTYSCGARRRSKGRNRYELLYGSRKCGAGCALAKHSRNGVEKM